MTPPVQSDQEQVLVRTFYRFTDLPEDRLPELREQYLELGKELALKGSVLLSSEGCNGTVAGSSQGVTRLFEVMGEAFPQLGGQDSHTDSLPFQRWKVQIRQQIVSARDQDLRPNCNFEGQKTPKEWDEVRRLVREGTAQMVDVRNSYEVALGTFPEAIDPGTETFKEFSDYLDLEVGKSLNPDTPTAIFCTGGIRCEKARMDLERRGFKSVWQLKGGILNYLKEKPGAGFDGECFVFDERVSVDQQLQPSQLFELCRGCGQPIEKSGKGHHCVGRQGK